MPDRALLQVVNSDLFSSIHLSVLRLDLIDEFGSGNKLFKLKYNLMRAKAEGIRRLISFGGAYSNHIHALALIGRAEGFETIGLIRGEPGERLNDTLLDAQRAGMELRYLSREDYRKRSDPRFLEQLKRQFPGCFWVPEGGSNLEGVRGCLEIGSFIDPEAELLILPCGTAATLAGVAAACPDRKICGVAVLKGASDLEQRVRSHLDDLANNGFVPYFPDNWWIEHDYHCGGYARVEPGLAGFLQRFESVTGIPAEPVYTGKMFYALHQMAAAGMIPPATRVTAIHTGGMQGVRGMHTKSNAMLNSSTQ